MMTMDHLVQNATFQHDDVDVDGDDDNSDDDDDRDDDDDGGGDDDDHDMSFFGQRPQRVTHFAKLNKQSFLRGIETTAFLL